MLNTIKLFDEIEADFDFSSLKRFPWDTDIKGMPYCVVSIPNRPHTIGGKYGINDLWCWPKYERPTTENTIKFDGSICRWGFKIEDNNYIRWKHGGEVRHNRYVTITRNGKDFYSFAYAGMGGSAAKAQILIDKFQEHPLELNSVTYESDVIGRKVWWRSQPAIVESWINGQACVILVPDGKKEFNIPAEFANEDSGFSEERTDVKVEILSENIWWFRD